MYNKENKSSRGLCSRFSIAFALAYVVVPLNCASSLSAITLSVVSSLYRLANPKSMRYVFALSAREPRPMQMFPGFTSLCTYPFKCVYPNASIVCAAIRAMVISENNGRCCCCCCCCFVSEVDVFGVVVVPAPLTPPLESSSTELDEFNSISLFKSARFSPTSCIAMNGCSFPLFVSKTPSS